MGKINQHKFQLFFYYQTSKENTDIRKIHNLTYFDTLGMSEMP